MQSLDFTRFRTLLERSKMDDKPHQSEGVRWCLSRETDKEHTTRGGIMADEMGLGKTIQMLGVIVCNCKKRTLIILPKALINQWINSIREIFNHEPLLYHGQYVNEITEEMLSTEPIVVSTYGMLDSEKKNNLLHKIKWSRIIFDEAHHLRNKKTKKLNGAQKLKENNNKCIMWFVTGTPIQNRLSDLHSLYKVLGISKDEYKNPQNHNNLIKKYLIKRMKKEIKLNIPETNEQTIFIDWLNEAERDVAEELHAYSVTQSKVPNAEKCKFTNPYEKPMLPFTMFAKQLCVCPKAFQPHVTNLLRKDKEDDETSLTNMLVNTGNSKMDTVIKTILKRKNNRKKLVFCQFKSEINTIKDALKSNGLTVDVVDGSTSKKTRNEILENQDKSQNQDPNYTLILQIQVGCEGLNLQSFSEVYFVSPNWNPAIEDQAIARCHRIGQEQQVGIFRFYMNDFDRYSVSLDSHIKEKQEEKRSIMI